MITLNYIWKKLTNTEALEKSSGSLETTFFETVYRVVYISGLSTAESGFPYLLYCTTVKLAIALIISGEIWFVFAETLSFDEIAASVIVIVIQFITIYRYMNTVIYKGMYKELATSMESPNFDISTAERKKLFDYWANKNNKYLKLLLFLGNCTLIAWFLHPLVDDLEYNMFIGIRFPFNYHTPTLYSFTYLATYVAFLYSSYFSMVTVLIIQAHLLHLVCQLTVLSDCFENITTDCEAKFVSTKAVELGRKKKERNPVLEYGIACDLLIGNKEFQEFYKKRLGDLVDQHRMILRYILEYRRILSGPMLGQLGSSGVLICFTSYQAATTGVDNVTKCLMSLFFLCYNLFEFYIICRWGEEITVQSQRIGEAAYCSNWENGLSKIPGVKSCLFLVIARANKPLVLSAGGMYNLSLESYTSLVKTSYSAFTVLLRFRKN